MPQIKVCKYCGGQAEYERKNKKVTEYLSTSEHVLHCTGCDYKTKRYFNSFEAIKEWNKKKDRHDER